MSTTLTTEQIKRPSGTLLETFLASLTFTSGINSATLPDGTIFKWGTTGPIATIAANTTSTQTVTFPVAFPNSCDFFHCNFSPAISTDFYGLTSIVSQTMNSVSYTIRNGATAQGITNGFWFALGR